MKKTLSTFALLGLVKLWTDALQKLGIAPLDARSEAVVQGGKLKSHTTTHTSESLAKLTAAELGHHVLTEPRLDTLTDQHTWSRPPTIAPRGSRVGLALMLPVRPRRAVKPRRRSPGNSPAFQALM